MAEATPIDVIESLQDYLDENIKDPNAQRRGKSGSRWIYTIPFSYDIATYPRIHIHDVASTHEGLSIGSTQRWMENRFQVSIFCGVGEGHKLDIDGDDEKERPVIVVDYLADQVIEAINDNQDRWTSLGTENNIHNVLTLEEQRVQDDENSVIQHDIDATIRMSR